MTVLALFQSRRWEGRKHPSTGYTAASLLTGPMHSGLHGENKCSMGKVLVTRAIYFWSSQEYSAFYLDNYIILLSYLTSSNKGLHTLYTFIRCKAEWTMHVCIKAYSYKVYTIIAKLCAKHKKLLSKTMLKMSYFKKQTRLYFQQHNAFVNYEKNIGKCQSSAQDKRVKKITHFAEDMTTECLSEFRILARWVATESSYADIWN